MTNGGARRRILGSVLALAFVGIGSWGYLESTWAIESTANRGLAIADSKVGALVDADGERVIVERTRSRIVVPEGASFRFDAKEPIARLRFDVAPSPGVDRFVFEWGGEHAPRVVVEPGANWSCSIESVDAGGSRSSNGDVPAHTPDTDAAAISLSCDGRRILVGIDGNAVVSAGESRADFRRGFLRAEGGSFELLRVDAFASDGRRIAREDFDELPTPEPKAIPPRVRFHLLLAISSALSLAAILLAGHSRAVKLLAGAWIAISAFASVSFVTGAVGGPLPEPRTRGAPCEPAAIEESLHLHAGNERRVDGPFADFRCEIRFATAWNSSLEVRMFGDVGEGDDVAVFRLATDPRLRTGFSIHETATGRARPIGFDIEAFEPNRLLDVTILSDAGLLRAYAVDALADDATQGKQRSQPVAEAFLPQSFAASGPISVRAMRGGMRVDRVAVSPVSGSPSRPILIDDPAKTESRARIRLAAGFVLATLLLAAASRASSRLSTPIRGFGFACAAVFPALVATIEPPLALGPFAAWVGVVPAFIVLLGATIVAFASAISLVHRVGAIFAFVCGFGLASLRLDLDPERSPLALRSELDFLGRAYETDLALERHVNTRREVSWRRAVRLHGDPLEPRREGDRKTVIVLGDSRVAGLDATRERRSEFAARLERGLTPGVGKRGVRVIDATWPDASLNATLAFLDEVLLASRGHEEVRALSFAPDLALIVLPVEAFLATREAELRRRADRDAFRGVVSAALDDAARVYRDDPPRREDAAALVVRFARIAQEAAAERCRIVVVVAPIEGMSQPASVHLDPSGVVDLFLPSLPAFAAGAPLFRDHDVLSARGRDLLCESVAKFLRKRVFKGGDQ